MKKTFSLILLLLITVAIQAQSAEEGSVTDVINRLFTGMYKNDTTLFKSAFANEVTLGSVLRNREGNVIVRKEALNGFVKNISKPQPAGQELTEEIWNVKVQIDGDFAQVWCDYAFYVGNKFSHCGVDAFHLYKSKDGWKIFHLVDTRRKEGCTIPQNIQDKHK